MHMTGSTPTTDLAELIARDHRRILELFESCKLAGGPRGELVEHLIRALSVHAGGEEVAVYPVIAEHFGDEVRRHSLDEHQHMKELLARLAELDPDSSSATAVLGDLEAEVRSHAAEEEGELLPRLRNHLDPDAWSRLGPEFVEAKESAPTRPHPNAPDEGLAAKAANMMAAPMDRLRDRLEGR